MAEITIKKQGLGIDPGDQGIFNNKLIAYIQPIQEMKIDGKVYYGAEGNVSDGNGSVEVRAFLEEAEFSLENQYSTPFESSNPEGRMPNLMGLAQSGQGLSSLTDLMNFAHISSVQPESPLSSLTSDDTSTDGTTTDATTAPATNAPSQDKSLFGKAQETLEGLVGRSTFTKLNSRQIFTSSNGVKISGTLVLTAWADAKAEVENALQKLQEWATPKYLADKSALMSGLTNPDGMNLQGFFPSEIPPTVSLQYGGKTYLPLVIENLSAPITAPMNANGDRIAVKVQITLASLTAWDKSDVLNLYK